MAFRLSMSRRLSAHRRLLPGRFDRVLACRLVNLPSVDLERSTQLPDVLAKLGLTMSRMALLYALGQEALLRDEGTIPATETGETVAEFMNRLAGVAVANRLRSATLLNEPTRQVFCTRVLGM